MKSYFEGRGRQSFTVSRIVKPKVKVVLDKLIIFNLFRLQYEEESDDVEQKEVASDLEE
jgi:hypothetical protein